MSPNAGRGHAAGDATGGATGGAESIITLRVPASGSHLVLARAAVSSICADLDFPVDTLDDVRLAVDEACSLLLADATPGSSLELRMSVLPFATLDITITATTGRRWLPPRRSFSWTVLQALVDEVTTKVEDGGRAQLRLLVRGSAGSRS